MDTPHHMKVDDDMPYREGVVLERPARKGYGSSVNVGMRKEVRIDRTIKPGLRVTVKMNNTSGEWTYTNLPASSLFFYFSFCFIVVGWWKFYMYTTNPDE